MSGAAGSRSLLRSGLRIAAYGCATLVLLAVLGAAFVIWRVGRYAHGTDPVSLAWKARLDATTWERRDERVAPGPHGAHWVRIEPDAP